MLSKLLGQAGLKPVSSAFRVRCYALHHRRSLISGNIQDILDISDRLVRITRVSADRIEDIVDVSIDQIALVV